MIVLDFTDLIINHFLFDLIINTYLLPKSTLKYKGLILQIYGFLLLIVLVYLVIAQLIKIGFSF